MARLEGSSPRDPVAWVHGASITFRTRPKTISTDRSALQVHLMALSVPSDRNRRLRWGCYLGGSGTGEAVESLKRSDLILQGTRDRSERSKRPDPRGPWTHHLYPGGRGGARGGHGGGPIGRHAGVLSGFCAPRAKMGYPSMSLTIGCGRQTRGPHRSWAEVGFQGVPPANGQNN